MRHVLSSVGPRQCRHALPLYVDSLEAFGKPFCTPEAFASGWGRLYYEILRVSSSGYEERVGDCLAQGETLGLYPNPYYSDEVYVYAENSCIVEPSYYTSFTLALYYD
ncbi:MAG: hypothetical protein LM577_03090 [Thermoproteaceae archaeon]|nr:hypothetical protein [Thermoproteaceae archaeon]